MFQWLSRLFGGKKKKANSPANIQGSKGGGLPPPKPLAKEDVDKRFDKGNRIGQGSMSKVFKALDRKLGRNVCLKLLDAKKTEHFESRFKGLNKPPEGEICQNLRHENIVQTLDYGVHSKTGEPFIVMEFVEGVGLNFLIETKSKKLEGNRVNYLRQIANGIEHLHKSGYMHRDICPRNIMVTNEGVVKLIDFGLAIPYRPEFCRPGNRTGTPNYLAPEIIRRSSTDLRVDLFALGVTAYEMFTQNLPWESSQSMQALIGHMNSPPNDPRDFVPNMPDATRDFLLKAIDRYPSGRFQTAADFREALDKVIE
jgi:serine/threonine protein kinase